MYAGEEAPASSRDRSLSKGTGPDEQAIIEVVRDVNPTFPFHVKNWVVEVYSEESLRNRRYIGTSAPAAMQGKSDNTNSTAAGEEARAAMTTPPGYPIFAPCQMARTATLPSSATQWRAVGPDQHEKGHVSAEKNCCNKDDLCGCPDWLGYHMDTDALHEGAGAGEAAAALAGACTGADELAMLPYSDGLFIRHCIGRFPWCHSFATSRHAESQPAIPLDR